MIPRSALARLARKYRIEFVVLFGSRARGTHRPESDADLCVVAPRFRGDEIELANELTKAMGMEADLVRFERSGPILRFHSVFPGKLLWGDPARFERLRPRALKEWQDCRKIDDALSAALDLRP